MTSLKATHMKAQALTALARALTDAVGWRPIPGRPGWQAHEWVHPGGEMLRVELPMKDP